MRKAVVEEATGKVVNVIEIKAKSKWTPPDGCILVDKQPAGNIGDTWDGSKFIPPRPELPTTFRYEAFTSESEHPKSDNPIRVDYEVLEFNEELTPQEVATLEAQLGRTIRRLQ